MNTVQIMIRGKSYTLRTGESEERMSEIAGALDKRITEFSDAMKGRTDAEILTLVAFDLMEQSDDYSKETAKVKQLLEESDVKNKQLLMDNMNSAESELFQIAAVKEQENNDLRAELQEYERLLENQVSDAYSSAGNELNQIASSNLHENNDLRIVEFERQLDTQAMSAIKEANDNAELKQREIQTLNAELESQKEENQNLKVKLENFEKTFDDYSKTKEREIVAMQEEIEKLKMKLAEASDDGQMTLV